MLNFSRRHLERAGGDEGGAGPHCPDVASVRRERQARQAGGATRAKPASSTSRTSARRNRLGRQTARPAHAGSAPPVARDADDPAVVLFTSGSEGTPEGRRAVATAICSPTPPARRAGRLQRRRHRASTSLPMFHSFGLTGGMLLPLLVGHEDLSVSVAAALPDRARARSTRPARRSCSAPTRSSPATHAWRTPTTSARCAMSSRAPKPVQGPRRARPTWSGSACASSKAMASPKPRR